MDEATAIAERAILGLRLREGVALASVTSPGLADGMAWAHAQGLVEDVDARVRLTEQGRLLANEVFARLLPEGPSAAGPDA